MSSRSFSRRRMPGTQTGIISMISTSTSTSTSTCARGLTIGQVTPCSRGYRPAGSAVGRATGGGAGSANAGTGSTG
jgi:hypothetical protein